VFDLKFSFSVVFSPMEDPTNRKFKIHDRLYQLGFSQGLLESAREKQINTFIERHKNNLDRLENWINWMEKNLPEVEKPGAYLRSMVDRGCEPNG